MIVRSLRVWLVAFSLLFSVSAVADVTVDSESLHLQFSERGDLLLVEACFPQCSKPGTKDLLLSATQGMLIFNQNTPGDWHLERETTQSATSLVFTNPSGNAVRRWVIPHKGWMVSFDSNESGTARLTSGMAFRPRHPVVSVIYWNRPATCFSMIPRLNR